MDAHGGARALRALGAARAQLDQRPAGPRLTITALYTPNGQDTWRPNEVTRGPWDPLAQHGGAPAALLGGLLDEAEPRGDMRVVRVSFELLRPVPLTDLRAEVEVVRPGRRVQLVEGRLYADDRFVMKATALRVRRAPGASPEVGSPGDEPPPGPEHGEPRHLDRLDIGMPSFAVHGVEIRFVEGSFGPGPAVAWIRLRGPVREGHEPTPLERALAAADFGNGVSAELDWNEHVFINPDLTVHIEREPEGEWVALDARTRVATDGTGLAESVLFDRRGRIGRAVQALLVEARPNAR